VITSKCSNAKNTGNRESKLAAEFNDIALVGFASSEKATFETFFRLVSSRRAKPFRAVDDVASAAVVFVDAGKDYRLIEVSDRLTARQVLVTFGAVRSSRSNRHLDRPINLNAVLMTLDAAVSAIPATAASAPASAPLIESRSASVNRNPAPQSMPAMRVSPSQVPPSKPLLTSPAAPVALASAPMKSASPAAPQSVIAKPLTPRPPPTAPSMPPSVASPHREPLPIAAPRAMTSTPPIASAHTATVTPLNALRNTSPAPEPVTRPEPQEGVRILVVDDSDVALKFIHNRLSAFGFSVDKCISGEEALVRVSDGDYAFVFLDVMMAGLDGYQTCKAIKGRRYPGKKAPVVVMLTSRGGTIDKVRGTFAGCDAYLTKPLDDVKMLKVLLKHDPNLGDSISTFAAPLAPSLPRGDPAMTNPLAASFENLADRAR
jgi:CheY-like chemotaxis protein